MHTQKSKQKPISAINRHIQLWQTYHISEQSLKQTILYKV